MRRITKNKSAKLTDIKQNVDSHNSHTYSMVKDMPKYKNLISGAATIVNICGNCFPIKRSSRQSDKENIESYWRNVSKSFNKSMPKILCKK